MNIASVQDYINEVNRIYKDNSSSKHLFFRGHSCKDNFKLQPSIFRNPAYNEKEIFLDFKQYAPVHNITYDFTTEKEKLLVDMQHYGIPTRLLDWTIAPLNALFFACCEKDGSDGQVIIFNPWKYWPTVVRDKSHPEIHQIHITARALLASGWTFSYINEYIKRKFMYDDLIPEDIRKPFPFVSTFTNERILHQRGCFTIHGTLIDEIDNIKECEEFINRIDISTFDKKGILNELSKLYINDYTVYPDFEGISKTIIRNKGLFNI